MWWIIEINICASAVIREQRTAENGCEKQRSFCERKDLSRISEIGPRKLKENRCLSVCLSRKAMTRKPNWLYTERVRYTVWGVQVFMLKYGVVVGPVVQSA